MNRIIVSILLSIILFFPFAGIIQAQEKSASPASVEIESSDIPSLTIDVTSEVPDFKLVPMPTPAPSPASLESKDSRSWTKFQYSGIIRDVASKYGLDPQLIYATIMTESEGDDYAFRYEPYIKDASLCMGQILLSTARSLGFDGDPKDMYKPEVCIDLVGKYHRRMIEDFGELTPLQLAAAYNTGSPWRRPIWGYWTRFTHWLNEES